MPFDAILSRIFSRAISFERFQIILICGTMRICKNEVSASVRNVDKQRLSKYKKDRKRAEIFRR